ncbi:MAG TPA: hypothetical protein VGJ82_03000 [Thermoanaerobaculia bacterium]|jgi:hypothetical protein
MQPERRKHVRILTIRNFGGATLVLLLALATANVISEMRAPRHGEYGRLTISAEPVAVKQPAVVTEAEVPDETPAGPPAALLSGPSAAAPAQQPVMASVQSTGATAGGLPSHAAMTDHVTIVGGSDGIHVETARRDAAPKLSGGIFRQ